MKKICILITFIALGMSSNTFAGDYTINDSKVESLLNSSIQNDFSNVDFSLNDMTALQGGDKQAIVAVLLDFFLGGIAIHRVYLGGSPILIAGYLFTFFGIFGILPLGDFIVLLVNFNDISRYVDNDAFVMW
jgi:hypothetical protein